MGKKKKKSKDPWVNAVRHIFNRKRANRAFTLSQDYISSVADSLHRTNPTFQIIKNTLSDFASVFHWRGYTRRIDDEKYFRNKQEQAFGRFFNEFKDRLDDKIHIKNQPVA